MKKIVMTAIAVCVIGCGNEAEAKTPVTKEIASNTNVIVVPNTEHIDYTSYRLEWRRVNKKPAPRWAPDVTLTTKPRTGINNKEVVEMHLKDLSFKEAFSIEFRAKGEGHTFWWRGTEYTTNLLDVVRKPLSDFKLTDPYIERVPTVTEDIIPVKLTTPTEEVKPTTGE